MVKCDRPRGRPERAGACTVLVVTLILSTAANAQDPPSLNLQCSDPCPLSVTHRATLGNDPEGAWMRLGSRVAMDREGGFVAWDTYDPGTVAVFSRTGEYLRSVGGPGEGPGEFNEIRDVSVLPDGSLAVLDGSYRLATFSEEGAYQHTVGSPRPYDWLVPYDADRILMGVKGGLRSAEPSLLLGTIEHLGGAESELGQDPETGAARYRVELPPGAFRPGGGRRMPGGSMPVMSQSAPGPRWVVFGQHGDSLVMLSTESNASDAVGLGLVHEDEGEEELQRFTVQGAAEAPPDRVAIWATYLARPEALASASVSGGGAEVGVATAPEDQAIRGYTTRVGLFPTRRGGTGSLIEIPETIVGGVLSDGSVYTYRVEGSGRVVVDVWSVYWTASR